MSQQRRFFQSFLFSSFLPSASSERLPRPSPLLSSSLIGLIPPAGQRVERADDARRVARLVAPQAARVEAPHCVGEVLGRGALLFATKRGGERGRSGEARWVTAERECSKTRGRAHAHKQTQHALHPPPTYARTSTPIAFRWRPSSAWWLSMRSALGTTTSAARAVSASKTEPAPAWLTTSEAAATYGASDGAKSKTLDGWLLGFAFVRASVSVSARESVSVLRQLFFPSAPAPPFAQDAHSTSRPLGSTARAAPGGTRTRGRYAPAPFWITRRA